MYRKKEREDVSEYFALCSVVFLLFITKYVRIINLFLSGLSSFEQEAMSALFHLLCAATVEPIIDKIQPLARQLLKVDSAADLNVK